jgi:hypothetical protein
MMGAKGLYKICPIAHSYRGTAMAKNKNKNLCPCGR